MKKSQIYKYSRFVLNLFYKLFRILWYKSHMKWQQKVGIAALALLILSSFFISYYLYVENTRDYLTVVFLDVGQGDAIFIEAPNGNQVLIDSGPTATVIRRLSEVLPFYDRSIDMIVATHHDADHTAAFPEVLKRYSVKQYVTSEKEDNDGLYFEIERLVEEGQVERLELVAGDRVVLDDEEEIYIDILWPPDGVVIDDNNEASLMTRIVYRDTSFMLTGDAGKEQELAVIGGVDFDLKSQVLKAGHHGSKTSSAHEFIATISPEFVVISAGLDNKFGHPHQEVLDTIYDWSSSTQKTVSVLETYAEGNIIFKSDGREVWLE